MQPSTTQPRQTTPLLLFFGGALLLSWALWLPQAAAAIGFPVPALPVESPLMLLAPWGPGIAAIIAALLYSGKHGVRALFAPLRRWRVDWRWYAFALLFPAVVWGIGRALDIATANAAPLESPLAQFGAQAAFMLPVLILFALPAALGEELGWRGFALPRLLQRTTPLRASILLGAFWGFWHIPTLVAQGALQVEAFALVGALLTPIPITYLYTWLYRNSGNSLLLVWLFHTADAVTQYLLPRLPTLTDDVVILLVVVGVLWLNRAEEKSDIPAKAALS